MMTMEQQLINELIRLLCKAGAESFVGNFQKEIDHDGSPGKWTSTEVTEATQYIKYINDYFGRDEAVAIITSLMGRYNILSSEFSLNDGSEKIGVGEIH
jgi:hypothetical protein